MEGIIAGTFILWLLSTLLVNPLAKFCVARKLVKAGLTEEQLAQYPDTQQAEWRSVATRQYILWDMTVLSIAGLIMGLTGYYFVGFSLKAKAWPGMLSFIVCSFLGVGLRGTA